MIGHGLFRGALAIGCGWVAALAAQASVPDTLTRFGEWQARHFSVSELEDPGVSGPQASPARDGVSNLFKYAVDLGAWAAVPAARTPQMRATSEGWVLDYSRRRYAPDLYYEVELSPDLAQWSADSTVAEEVGATPEGSTERVSVWLKNVAAEPVKFARVRISHLPAPVVTTRPWVGWDFSLETRVVPQPPTASDESAATDGLRLGPGLSSGGASRTWGASGWGRTSTEWLTSPEAAVALGKYIEFTVTPPEGRMTALVTLRYKVRRILNAPTDFLWQYRVGEGEFVTLGTSQNYTGIETNGVQQPDIDLSQIAALQAVREAVTFRFVAWNGNSLLAFGRDSGEALTVLMRDRAVSEVLADGQGDFDPWNQARWAAWYRDGELWRPFLVDCSLRFAARAEPWSPDVSGLPANSPLFRIVRPGVVIDGNGAVIDVRNPLYRDRQLAQLIAGGAAEATDTHMLSHGFYFAVPATAGIPSNGLRNLTVKGFVQGVRTAREHSHPLTISRVTFTRNSTGLYLSGSGVLATECDFFENSHTANYSGSGSSGNRFVQNRFRDNNYVLAQSYADLVFDTAYGSEVRENQFLPSTLPQGQYRVAMSFYRNLGEDNSLREDFPRNNVVVDNVVDGYSVGFYLGSRYGRANHVHDISGEGRDYVARNLIVGNTLRNTTIGVKVNTSGNTVEGNFFSAVALPIVLHAAGYSLTETTINDQSGIPVALWTESAHYTSFASWFSYQAPLMNVVPAAEKLVHVRSERGAPSFGSPGAATLWLADSLALDASLSGVRASGGTPRALAVGDFYENQAGDELAVIWEEPISRVGETSNYSILFFDRDGIEINRAGRSTTKWGGVVAGKFAGTRGEQVAVFSETPIDGAYPILVFRRGYREPLYTLLPNNPHRIRALAAGNFQPSDELDELAVIFEDGPTSVTFVKPTDAAWSVQAESPVRLAGIVGGRFLTGRAESQVAAIGAVPDAETGTHPIYFFSAAEGLQVALAASGESSPWVVVGAGDLVPSREGDEVVVVKASSTGEAVEAWCYAPGESAPRRVFAHPNLASVPRSLGAGMLTAKAMNAAYERGEGLMPQAEPVDAWGESLVWLPAAAPQGTPPAMWLNVDPADASRRYFRITPLVR